MTTTSLKLLVVGRGKTGSLVAEVASARGHSVRAVGSAENAGGKALTPEALADIDVVVDFTTPRAVVENVEACARARKNIVVGTTGWYDEMERVGEMVKKGGIGFVYGANFSIGVNLFFDIARAAAVAFEHGYEGRILERHHVQKKDAPSGTAMALRKVLQEVRAGELLIGSEREGEVVGYHELVLESDADTITLSHNAKSRRGFAEGAVRAAEWIAHRKGFYDFKDVWRSLR
ncbi:MAG: 4-hydroxy-tetrahydrodipicolinate reductase [Terriglobales bacterium]